VKKATSVEEKSPASESSRVLKAAAAAVVDTGGAGVGDPTMEPAETKARAVFPDWNSRFASLAAAVSTPVSLLQPPPSGVRGVFTPKTRAASASAPISLLNPANSHTGIRGVFTPRHAADADPRLT
jgi:hypothetical protein